MFMFIVSIPLMNKQRAAIDSYVVESHVLSSVLFGRLVSHISFNK